MLYATRFTRIKNDSKVADIPSACPITPVRNLDGTVIDTADCREAHRINKELHRAFDFFVYQSETLKAY